MKVWMVLHFQILWCERFTQGGPGIVVDMADCDKRESEKAEPEAVVPVCWDPMDPESFEDDFSLIVETQQRLGWR